jgi:hypothetical protein
MDSRSVEGGKKRGRAPPPSDQQLSSILPSGWSIKRWRIPIGTPLYHVHVYWPHLENRLLTISDDLPPFPVCSSDSSLTTSLPSHQLYMYRDYNKPVTPAIGMPYMPGDYIDFWLDVNAAHESGKHIIAETKLPAPSTHASHGFSTSSSPSLSLSPSREGNKSLPINHLAIKTK